MLVEKRKKDLKFLSDMLEKSKNVVLVNGMGGIGKTTLAIAYLDHCKDQYDHIAWLEQLGQFSDIVLTNKLLLKNLGIQSLSGEPEQDTCYVLNQLANLKGNCLLVIDNADDRIKPYRDHLPRDWHVLITSRQELGFKNRYDLSFLDVESAMELFYIHYDHTQNDALVKEIIEAVDFHTLTIELLARTAYRKRRTLPLDKLWELVKMKGIKLEKIINVSTTHSHQKSIEKIFPYLCSVFEVQDLPENEILLLKQLACLPPIFHSFEDLSSWLQLKDDDKIEKLEDMLLRLKEKGWLVSGKKADAYKIHRIIQEVISEQLEIREADVSTLLDTFKALTSHNPAKNPVDQFQWLPFGTQLLSVIKKDKSKEIGGLSNNIGLLYQAQGQYEPALEFFQKAIAICSESLGDQHPNTQTIKNNLERLRREIKNKRNKK